MVVIALDTLYLVAVLQSEYPANGTGVALESFILGGVWRIYLDAFNPELSSR
jgi:hypothetical protein